MDRTEAVTCWMSVAALVTVTLAACSGGGDGTTVNSPTSPSNPSNPNASLLGGWTGTTAQGKMLSLLVTDAGVTLVMVGWRVQGTTCTSDIVQFVSRIPASTAFALSAGAFTASQTGSLGTTTLGGTLLATGSASGTLSINDTRCNGTANSTWTATRASGPEINLAGVWSANFASSLVTRTNGTLLLSQTGAAVTGSYSIPSNGAAGSFVGTVSGRTATFTLTQTTQGCTGVFTGHAVLMQSPELLTYFYSGSDCLGTHTGGNGSASK